MESIEDRLTSMSNKIQSLGLEISISNKWTKETFEKYATDIAKFAEQQKTKRRSIYQKWQNVVQNQNKKFKMFGTKIKESKNELFKYFNEKIGDMEKAFDLKLELNNKKTLEEMQKIKDEVKILREKLEVSESQRSEIADKNLQLSKLKEALDLSQQSIELEAKHQNLMTKKIKDLQNDIKLNSEKIQALEDSEARETKDSIQRPIPLQLQNDLKFYISEVRRVEKDITKWVTESNQHHDSEISKIWKSMGTKAKCSQIASLNVDIGAIKSRIDELKKTYDGKTDQINAHTDMLSKHENEIKKFSIQFDFIHKVNAITNEAITAQQATSQQFNTQKMNTPISKVLLPIPLQQFNPPRVNTQEFSFQRVNPQQSDPQQINLQQFAARQYGPNSIQPAGSNAVRDRDGKRRKRIIKIATPNE